ncbi:single Ig IL-1-related receptor isoform X3 [Hyla sarda]|uniref:single Ig IL-1-related receptor isoform X3 n=1 Tax=Hyla sarda TaxID=327740 RepID=UPI0024C2111D|nr:single Ig IL-1-related receptor isoform X3 [Hyla sarda]
MAGTECGLPINLISPPTAEQELWPHLGTTVSLNCTLQVPDSCSGSVTWLKNGEAAGHLYAGQDTVWNDVSSSVKFISSVLGVNLTTDEDYGKFTCQLQNVSASFTLHKTDGRLFDACVSFCPSNIDTKFTNFILKPQLENRYGYKLHLDERSLLPSTEPSAELLMNVSRCRRLIVVLSMAYLEQEWCQNNFRDGFFRLLELSQTPIFILFENQYKDLPAEVIHLLNSQKGTLKTLMWKADSVSPASDFWKELRLALPRKISLSDGKGDPQTQCQDDKDPMLTLNSEATDLDPDGDLGVRRTFYKAPPPRIAPVTRVPDREPTGEVDISDLGSRNYSARSDYYCLVTEPDL